MTCSQCWKLGDNGGNDRNVHGNSAGILDIIATTVIVMMIRMAAIRHFNTYIYIYMIMYRSTHSVNIDVVIQ